MNGRGVRLTAVAAAVAALVAAGAEAAERVLFPAPLHLVRQVDDPLTGKTTTISELCSGSRIASVVVEGGVIARVSAVDFAADTPLEIDRIADTWSLSTFAEIARAAAPRVQAAAAQRKWVFRSEGNQAI